MLLAVRAQRDELLNSLTASGRQLEVMREQVREVGNLTELQLALTEAKSQVETSHQQAVDMRQEAAAAAERFGEAARLMAAARADADAAVRVSREQADAAQAEMDRARRDADSIREALEANRYEFASLAAEAQETLRRLQEAVAEARSVTVPLPPSPPAEPPAEVPAEPEPSLEVEAPAATEQEGTCEVAAVPVEEMAPDAPRRLARLLNDALAVDKELVGVFQSWADVTEDADLRAELEGHRVRSHQRQEEIAERVRFLGEEPGGGRGLLGQLVTHIWDALKRPPDGDQTVESLLRARSAAELEAGLFLAIGVLARAINDGETADLAEVHLRQERDFSDRLWERITPSAVRIARGRQVAPGESREGAGEVVAG